MYTKKGLLALTLIFCLFETAFSIKCYTCFSTIDGECYKDPKNHTIDCNVGSGQSTSTDANSNTLIAALSNAVGKTGKSLVDEGSMCGLYTAVHESSNKSAIVRMCTHKDVSCEIMKLTLALSTGFTIKSCNNCTTDYCNSSSSVKAGAFMLFPLFFTILFSYKL